MESRGDGVSGTRRRGRTVVLAAVGGPACAAALITVFAFVYSVPSMARLGAEPSVAAPDGFTIDDAITHCQGTALDGWELVEHAQRLTANRFRYSRRNPWDSPRQAFERGVGYCLQQARALKRILDALGFESRLVMGSGRFPPAIVHGELEPASIGRHAWLRVTVAGDVKDVCPGHPDNSPGNAHFVVTSNVRTLDAWMVPFAHVGSIIVNSHRDRPRAAASEDTAGADARDHH